MKKLLLIFILLSNVVSANNNYELKLYEKVIPSIFTQTPIKVYADDDIKQLLSQSDKFTIVNNCSDSVVLLIGKDFEQLPSDCQDKPIFATSYRKFKQLDNSFGAFYWRKGRPQIKFKLKTIQRYHLDLPQGLKKYAQ